MLSKNWGSPLGTGPRVKLAQPCRRRRFGEESARAVAARMDGDPKWSTHSLRRLGDTVARRFMEVTARGSGGPDQQIDIFFGWHEKILLKAMQVHYASMSIRERMRTVRVTGWM